MGERMSGALENSGSSRPNLFRVIGPKGQYVLGEEKTGFPFPMTRVKQLYAGTLPIATVEYTEDVSHIVFRSILSVLLGAALGSAMFIVLKVLPLRALRTALMGLQKANKEINNYNKNLENLVAERTSKIEFQANQLKQALAKEQQLNELQRQFVSMASHEFRTPLTIIDGAAQRLKRKADKNLLTREDAVRRVEKIRDAVRRMTRLMESTLDAARMEEGKMQVEIKPCDIGKVVRDVCARQQDISHTHVISYDLADLPETIQADTGYLEQALANLLSNAVKYAPDAPDIAVKARREDDQVALSVRDHGLGIDEDELERIGERFFRAKTSTGITGTGIGLNLAKTLVEMHDGSVSVESKKGEGSTFTVRLPIAGPDQSEQVDTKVA
jgi:signal transduction histidine kinase